MGSVNGSVNGSVSAAPTQMTRFVWNLVRSSTGILGRAWSTEKKMPTPVVPVRASCLYSGIRKASGTHTDPTIRIGSRMATYSITRILQFPQMYCGTRLPAPGLKKFHWGSHDAKSVASQL